MFAAVAPTYRAAGRAARREADVVAAVALLELWRRGSSVSVPAVTLLVCQQCMTMCPLVTSLRIGNDDEEDEVGESAGRRGLCE